jgi:hypothetical protein
MKIYLVTVATDSQGYLPVLKESCEKLNINLVILGWGEKWKGFTWRFELVRKYLETLNCDDVCVFIDAFDVIILKSLDEILKRFLKYNTPILFSKDGKLNNFIHEILYKRCFKKCKNYNINAGTYMGYVWALKLMFDKICEKNDCNVLDKDDQELLISLCEDPFFDKYVKIDVDQDIFLNILTTNIFSDKIDYTTNKTAVLNDYGKEPCIIHTPGNGDLHDVARMYNLKSVENFTKISFLKGAWSRIKIYLPLFSGEIVIFILVVLIIILILMSKS